MTASLHYLTVQDMLWINLQATKKVQHFDYARLEEATFYQYAYGESNTLAPQAARFMSGFLKLRPFNDGNEATALIGCLAFLAMNGYEIIASEEKLATWFNQISSKQLEGAAAVEQIGRQGSGGHHALGPDVKGTIREMICRYEDLIEKLGG